MTCGFSISSISKAKIVSVSFVTNSRMESHTSSQESSVAKKRKTSFQRYSKIQTNTVAKARSWRLINQFYKSLHYHYEETSCTSIQIGLRIKSLFQREWADPFYCLNSVRLMTFHTRSQNKH